MSPTWRPVLDPAIPKQGYVPIDFSWNNPALNGIPLEDPGVCQDYVTGILNENRGAVAYGGYLERRSLYDSHSHFGLPGGSGRNIHLGVDFWAPAGTTVVAPYAGSLHSFRDNAGSGNYGPTLILSHSMGPHVFYSLYGHLSRESLLDVKPGMAVEAGTELGTLGTSMVNGGYAPHLHFQLILDIGDYKGDYPGVCSSDTLGYYAENCPDPCLLLHY